MTEQAESAKKLEVTMYELKSGKKVYFREPKIKDSEDASRVAGKEADEDNGAHLMVLVQKEMIKLLLVQVDDTRIGALERNNLDALFTFREYNQVTACIQHFMSDGDEGNLSLNPTIVSL